MEAILQQLQYGPDDIGGFDPLGDEVQPSQTRVEFPEQGRAWSDIKADLISHKENDYDWRNGRLPIYVYHDSDELLSVSREAYNLYFSENALGRRAFPSLVRMEQDIIAMSLALFHAPNGAAGSFTSGGTESIFLTLKSARDRFRSTKNCTYTPTIVVPRTAHPAFDKAAHYLGVEVIRTRVGTNLRADVLDLQAAIDHRTMMIVGSAPCYPYGVYDPIDQLGDLALAKQVWLHVDACLGGFLAPFARDEGYSIPTFDFAIPGVSSLSADLHKYGFSARGASVVLYRSNALKMFQPFEFNNWPRGYYSTETFLGSRPGGAIASAWAVFQYLGRSGYRRLARTILETKQRFIEGVERIPGLEIVRPTDLSIVLYRSTDPNLDINAVADALAQKDWFVGRSREPQALHFALNAVHAPVIKSYLADLKEAVDSVRKSRRVGTYDDNTY